MRPGWLDMSLATTKRTDNKSCLIKVTVVDAIISILITLIIIIVIRIIRRIVIIHTKLYCAIYIGGIIQNKFLINKKFLCLKNTISY